MANRFPFLIVLLGFWSGLAAQSVTIALDTSTIAIGAPVGLNIYADRALTAGSGQFDWPDWQDTLSGGLEILRTGTRDTLAVVQEDGSDAIRITQTLWVTSWDSGFRAIPPVALVWEGDTVLSNPLLLEVLLAPPGEPGKIAAPADIIRVQWTWKERIAQALPWILGSLLLIGLVIWLLRRKPKAAPDEADKTAPAQPIEPAHIIALRELERIESEAVWKRGHVKEHHAAVSSVLRAYFEHRYGFRAMERSTDEIRSGLVHLPIRRSEQALALEVLQTTDLVKFAKWNPTTDDHRRIIECSVRFVEQTADETSQSPQP